MELLELFRNSTAQVQDDKRPFIDKETFTLLMLINPVVITCTISIFGIAANLINIFIFAKLGFKDTINISLVALAVSDLASLLCLVWMSLTFSTSFANLFDDVEELQYYEDSVIGSVRGSFTTIGGWITCLIAFERCLCVLRPLQVRLILSKERFKLILPSIAIVCVIPYGIVFYVVGMDMVMNERLNISLLGDDEDPYLFYELDQISNSMISFFTSFSYVMVIVFTVLIVWKLTSQSRWRAKQLTTPGGPDDSSSKQDSHKGLSEKDRRATMTVTVIAAMYIVCFFPQTVLYVAMTYSIEFNKGMQYTHLYDFLWYVAYTAEGICASANIIVYIKSSTKFKGAFCAMFGCSGGKNSSKSLNTSRALVGIMPNHVSVPP